MAARPHRRSLLATATPLAAALAVVAAGPGFAQDFEAVLAAPDDPILNLAYARDQALQGNLSISASALERILIAEPNRHSVRLFYAVVLYRLGDMQGAREQLKQLEGVNLPPLQRAEANSYARRVEQGLATGSISGRLGVGVAYENDAAGAYFTAFDIIGAPASEEGVASEVSLRLDGRASIGASRVYEVYGTGLFYDRSSLSGAAVDFQRADIEAGVSRTTRLTESRIGAVVRHVRLEGEPQLTEAGVRSDTRWRATNALTLTAQAEIVSQDFDEPAIDAVAAIIGGDRDGDRYVAGVGMVYRATARTSLGLGVDYEVKTAGYDAFGYAGPRLSASFDQRFGKGVYVLATSSMRWLDYDAADVFFLGGSEREDTRSAARLALGAPLSAFTAAGATGDIRENLTLEAALNYSRRDSSAPLADFDGWGAELRLVWRFGARQ